MRLRAILAALAATTVAAAAVPASAAPADLGKVDAAAGFHAAALGQEDAEGQERREVGMVFFKEGKAQLSPASEKLLDRLPRILDLDGETVVVISSPDEDPGLAQARAEAVQDYLADKGITETRIRTEDAGAAAMGSVLLRGADRVVMSTAETRLN